MMIILYDDLDDDDDCGYVTTTNGTFGIFHIIYDVFNNKNKKGNKGRNRARSFGINCDYYMDALIGCYCVVCLCYFTF